MFYDREKRKKLRTILMISTAALGALFVMLLIYGFIAIRPYNIEKASKLGQYYEFNSSSLPSNANTIQKNISNNHHALPEGRKDTEIVGNIPSLDQAKPISYKKGRIAILVGNLGLNPLSTDLAVALPKEVSLGFLPYITSLRSSYVKALQEGHETFIYLPFETKRYPDDSPGQMPLLTSLDDEENIRRMYMLLDAFEGYAGVYGAPHEIFTNNSRKVGAILNELFSKKLKLLTSNGLISSGEIENSIISCNVLIDQEPNIAAIKKRLDSLVAIALSGKTAIGYAGSYPVTIYTIQAWLPTLKELDIEIVPITQVGISGVRNNGL